MSKRKILPGTALIAAGALLLTACSGGGASSGESLTVTMWGGGAQEAHVATVFEPWAEEVGMTIRQDAPTDYAQLDAMIAAGDPSWGVVEVEPNYSANACADGRLELLSDEVLAAAAAAEVDPDQVTECGIPILQYTFSIAYNTDTFSDSHPTNWEEFFDVEQFPGKRGFWRYVTGGVFEAALLADGVAAADLYPLDLDRAFAKLDTIKEHIVWYDTGDEQVQLVASGEAPLVQAWNGRITQAAAEGQPVANEYNENLISYDHVVIPAGYANAERAQEWMVWFLENPEAQSNQAVESGYGPASPLALDYLDADVMSDLAGSDVVNGVSAGVIDYDYWAEQYAPVTERFNVWVAQ